MNLVYPYLREPLFALAAAAAVISIVFFLVVAYRIGRHVGRTETRAGQDALLRAERKDAVKRSRAVLGGQFGEQLAPFFPGFPCNPGDVRFLGKPVDFIGFPGAAEGEKITEILFIEVKTGTAGLSKREREIRDAIQHGRVRYVEYNPGITDSPL
jgi:predicted Holliday junction resolvase-like endonuclease